MVKSCLHDILSPARSRRADSREDASVGFANRGRGTGGVLNRTKMTRPRSVHLLLTAMLAQLFAGTVAGLEPALIAIDADHAEPAINPRMYGIFLEEINHGVDGGLYGELVRNRAFEDSRAPEGYVFKNGRWENRNGFDSGFSRYGYTTNGVPFWHLIRTGDARGDMHLQTTGGITDESAYCLRLEVDSVTNGILGVANEGFFGIGVRKDVQQIDLL